MEFFDILEKRYSMRGFEDKEVEKEKAHELLQNMLKNFSKPRVPKL